MAQRQQGQQTGAYLTQLERRQGGGYLIDWRAATSEEWHVVLDRVRRLPEATRTYQSEEGIWWIDSTVLSQVAPWFGNFAQMLNRNPDTPPVRWTPPSTMPPDVSAAFATLCLTPDAPVELIKAAQRVLAKRYHPDTGGNHEMMLRVNLAVERATHWAKQRTSEHR